jgi:hypothetical protein
MEKITIKTDNPMGLVWIVGWLFTIGFLHLPFWNGVLAIIIWPYYIGVFVSSVL